jgi:peroxiredoxin
VFIGPDPIGLRPSAQPSTVAEASPSPSPSGSPASPRASGSAGPSPSSTPSGEPSPNASDASQTGFHVGEVAPALDVPQVGGGTIDLANLRGKAVWLNFMQTSCPECIDEFPLMSSFQARYEKDGLVVIAVDIREDAGTVASFAVRLGATFPLGLDLDGRAQRDWSTYALPIHFWIDRTGIVRAGALGGVPADQMAAGLVKILPGVKVTP